MQVAKVAETDAEKEQARLQRIADAARIILENIGEDPSRAGLLDTPMRMAKAMAFFTQGYKMTLDQGRNAPFLCF